MSETQLQAMPMTVKKKPRRRPERHETHRDTLVRIFREAGLEVTTSIQQRGTIAPAPEEVQVPHHGLFVALGSGNGNVDSYCEFCFDETGNLVSHGVFHGGM